MNTNTGEFMTPKEVEEAQSIGNEAAHEKRHDDYKTESSHGMHELINTQI